MISSIIFGISNLTVQKAYTFEKAFTMKVAGANPQSYDRNAIDVLANRKSEFILRLTLK